ncbi:MAG: hypothetical protein ACYDCQ_13215 [Dehalococcoidia bacterium]
MTYTAPMQSDVGGLSNPVLPPLPPPGEKRRIDLHRRRAIVTADRIDVRPSRAAIVPPLFGFLLGALCVGFIVIGVLSNAVPYWLLAFLLLIALLAVPLTGITLVYALFGANVIFDRAKQSGTWQQGLLGMGIGTTELVPFWKIDAIIVAEAGTSGGARGRRTEEFAQWEAVLLKKSGKTLSIGSMTVPRQFSSFGMSPVKDLADAIAALTGVSVRVESEVAPATAEQGTGEPLPPETGPRRREVRPAQPPRRRRPEARADRQPPE